MWLGTSFVLGIKLVEGLDWVGRWFGRGRLGRARGRLGRWGGRKR